MTVPDPAFETLLDLDGSVFVLGPSGHWVKFVVKKVAPSAERPHGLVYSLTLHAANGDRLVGFDNAHPIQKSRRNKRKTLDHRHRLRTVLPYDYSDAASLLEAFWREVDAVLNERGVMR